MTGYTIMSDWEGACPSCYAPIDDFEDVCGSCGWQDEDDLDDLTAKGEGHEDSVFA
jgi:predicted amidophosphoribosyltransferase